MHQTHSYNNLNPSSSSHTTCILLPQLNTTHSPLPHSPMIQNVLYPQLRAVVWTPSTRTDLPKVESGPRFLLRMAWLRYRKLARDSENFIEKHERYEIHVYVFLFTPPVLSYVLCLYTLYKQFAFFFFFFFYTQMIPYHECTHIHHTYIYMYIIYKSIKFAKNKKKKVCG
jgi:hypothetical protein